MKKTWTTPVVESVELAATATDFAEAGNDTGVFDAPGFGEGCSLIPGVGSQCAS